MLRGVTRVGLPLTSLCFALIASATQAVGAKPAAQCMTDANFAITETGLQVSFTSGPHIGVIGPH